MTTFVCQTCGVSYPDAPLPPAECPICEDERQFVPASGQAWTTHPALLEDHAIEWTEISAGLHALKVKPNLAIAQRAFLLETSAGAILWDCLPILDEATAERIEAMGGLGCYRALAPSLLRQHAQLGGTVFCADLCERSGCGLGPGSIAMAQILARRFGAFGGRCPLDPLWRSFRWWNCTALG